jgi:hypothetical protein
MTSAPTPKFLKPENLVVGLFGLLVSIAGVDAERMIAAQKETNDKVAALTEKVAALAVTQAQLSGRVDAHDDRINSNRIYITNVDNRVRDLELNHGGRKINLSVPSAPIAPIRKASLDVDRSADRTRTAGTVLHVQKISTPVDVKRPNPSNVFVVDRLRDGLLR